MISALSPLPKAQRVPRAAQAVAAGCVVLGAAAAGLGLLEDGARTWTTLLVNGFFWVALALAGLLFIAIQYLARAGWWVAIRRVPEA
ncbi:MAG: hypothetical protein M3O15_11415, partial [Acidobacteriota bacterium]|nr:hypothetical protein [Acidobacteriota bacterium]